ncbi:MAG: protein kinase [Polyangiaceae bacterium]|nr:protein kinase [Polyangiaceae bacterium]MCE7891676.1 serine/threonine protein kinase [Sorangiineae bacterium PRO1]MCL4752141.1 protein kinase [Myxococcales bacterium]
MSGDADPQPSIAAPVRPGDVLAKKYRITRVLGAGGMGVVVAAEDVELDRAVAVKFLSPEGAANPNIVARFKREARAAVKITSEHVAKVIEVGQLDGGEPYIVMELLEGSDLADRVAAGPLPVEDALDYVLQACEAIAEAHSKGIVHRDLKPANLFLTKRADGSPCVKVLDFGISSMSGPNAPDHALTRTGAIMGSPFYMSPEQAKSARTADGRSDIWSLGAVLFELLAGRPPFLGETMGELIAAILTEEPKPLRALRPDAPEGLEAVVVRCLAKEPAARYATVGELAKALAPFAPERARLSITRAAAVSAGPDSAVTADTVPGTGTLVMTETPQKPAQGSNTAAAWSETRSPVEQAGEPDQRRRPFIIGAVALAVVAGVSVALLRPGGTVPPAGSGAPTDGVPAAAVSPSPSLPAAPPTEVATPASALVPSPSAEPRASTAKPASPAAKPLAKAPTKAAPGPGAEPVKPPSPTPNATTPGKPKAPLGMELQE